MVNLKSILSLQTFSHIFFVLIVLGVPIYGDASLQAIGQSGSLVIRQSGNPAIWQGAHLASIALAATEGGDHHGGVPKVVFYQVLNFLLFAGLLFYLLRDKVKSFYQSRFDLFQQQFKASRREREEIESSYKEYQQKLQKIDLTSDSQIAEARQEAGATKTRMLNEAHLESERIQREAQTLLDLEHKKAKRIIQFEFVEKIVEKIQSEISKSLTNEDKKSLIKKLEVSLK